MAGLLVDEISDVDGILCATDVVAIGAIRALRERGLRVPEDVRVIGFDDVPLDAFLTPSLSSIAPDHEAMADAAISMLTERISGTRAPGEYRSFVADVRLMARESTA